MKKNSLHILFFVFLFSVFSGCKVKYSFSGADIDPNLKTVSIAYIDNNSGNGPANMGNLLTDALKEKVLRETNLSLINGKADINFSGSINQYYYTVQSPTGNETSDIRRITMVVGINFQNNVTENENWETDFRNIAEHSVDIDLNSIEQESIVIINDLLIQDIFNKAFVKW